MKTIIIGFSTPNTFKIGAELIKLWTDSSFSHVYIRYIDDQDRDIVFQAAHGSVHPILYTNFIKSNKTINEYRIQFTNTEYQQLRDFYYSEMGQLYSYKELLMIVVYDTLDMFNIKIKEDNIPGYICSELAATMLQQIKGYTYNKQLNLIRPNDLYEVLENKYGDS